MPQGRASVVNVRYLRTGSFERNNTFKFIKSLKPGGQGHLDVFRLKSTRELIVCKYVPHKGVDYLPGKDEPVEVKILRDFLPKHPRIMNFLDYSVYREEVRLFYDFYEGGDVDGLINSFSQAGQRIPELLIWELFLQMSEALAFLHFGCSTSTYPPGNFRAIIHRDIKPANILLRAPITGDRSRPSFVLADFGFATRAEDRPTSKWQRVGTPDFAAPEATSSVGSTRGDIWGLGATVHAMAHKNQGPIAPMPLSYPNTTAGYVEWAKKPESKLARGFGNRYSRSLEDMMFACLKYDQGRRLSSLELLGLLEREFKRGGWVYSNL